MATILNCILAAIAGTIFALVLYGIQLTIAANL